MSTKPAAYHKRKEIIILIVSIVLLVTGVVIDSLGICLVEMEASSFNGIYTTMVSVQATVSVVIFSLVSIFSSFQTTEKIHSILLYFFFCSIFYSRSIGYAFLFNIIFPIMRMYVAK